MAEVRDGGDVANDTELAIADYMIIPTEAHGLFIQCQKCFDVIRWNNESWNEYAGMVNNHTELYHNG
jgi:hypothetical protein